jgi:hypothetical protein
VEWDSDLVDQANVVVRGNSVSIQYATAGFYILQGRARINGKIAAVANIQIRVGSARASLTREERREALFRQVWGDED